jgi:hypothetical protein
VIDVGGGEQARRRRDLRGGGSAVVARAVETLVVEAGNRRERGQEPGAGEDALGVVGVQPDPLPVVRRERRGLLPDAGRDRHPPKIVHQPAAPDLHQVSVLEAAPLRRRCGQLGDTGRVAHQVRRARSATERALDTGDYGPLGDVVERWWRAARLEDRGGPSWQRQKHLAEEGRWDELFPGPGRDVDEVVEELLR